MQAREGVMKILQSYVSLSSYYNFEEKDLLQEETSSRTLSKNSTALTLNNGSGLADSSGGIPLVWADQVSISATALAETRSEYSHGISSESRVSTVDGEPTSMFSQEEVVEKLVSSVTGTRVSARILDQYAEIRQGFSDADTGVTVSGFQKNSNISTITLDRTTSHYEQEQMTFSSAGQVMTEDGRIIDFSLDLAMDRSTLTTTAEHAVIQSWQEQMALIDPLMISLDGTVPELGDIRFEFDLDNDGTTEEISFAASGSGFLSFDKNSDGVINDGSELFGPGTGNGFGELGVYDLDGNGWIDENDDVFSKLSVWTKDEAGNDVLTTLADAGIGAIYLGSAQTGFELTGADNTLQGQVQQSGVFLFENGNVGMIQQIDLAARSIEEAEGPDAETGLFNERVITGTAPLPDSAVEKASDWLGFVDDIENPLEEMIKQIRDMQKAIRKILNMETQSGKRIGQRRQLKWGFLNKGWMQKRA